MSKEQRLWRIENERLIACSASDVDFERRLEIWLEKEISILDPELLVIGRQVEADFGFRIDLLCINADGDLVIVELKRERTHRDAVAQVLDYGAWATQVSSNRIEEIASEYFKREGTLEEVFSKRFQRDYPEILGSGHQLLIVAPEIDPPTARLISYLSSEYGVNINGVTFTHFNIEDSMELLGRVFLIEPETVEQASRSSARSKRLPNLTPEELLGLARNRGCTEIYETLATELSKHFNIRTTRSSLNFWGHFAESKNASLMNLFPGRDFEGGGLYFNLYIHRISENLGVPRETIIAALPAGYKAWEYCAGVQEDMTGYEGTFKNLEEVKRFLDALNP